MVAAGKSLLNAVATVLQSTTLDTSVMCLMNPPKKWISYTCSALSGRQRSTEERFQASLLAKPIRGSAPAWIGDRAGGIPAGEYSHQLRNISAY
jgi:hypothetical protein